MFVLPAGHEGVSGSHPCREQSLFCSCSLDRDLPGWDQPSGLGFLLLQVGNAQESRQGSQLRCGALAASCLLWMQIHPRSPPHFHPRSHGALPALSGFAAAGGRDGLDFYCRDRLPSPEPIPAPGTRLQQHKQSFQAVKNPLQGHIYKTQYLQNGPVKLNCSSARANSPITAGKELRANTALPDGLGRVHPVPPAALGGQSRGCPDVQGGSSPAQSGSSSRKWNTELSLASPSPSPLPDPGTA